MLKHAELETTTSAGTLQRLKVKALEVTVHRLVDEFIFNIRKCSYCSSFDKKKKTHSNKTLT